MWERGHWGCYGGVWGCDNRRPVALQRKYGQLAPPQGSGGLVLCLCCSLLFAAQNPQLMFGLIVLWLSWNINFYCIQAPSCALTNSANTATPCAVRCHSDSEIMVVRECLSMWPRRHHHISDGLGNALSQNPLTIPPIQWTMGSFSNKLPQAAVFAGSLALHPRGSPTPL